MAPKNTTKDTNERSISDTLKEMAEATNEATNTPEEEVTEGATEEPEAATAWGGFAIETGIAPPTRGGTHTKYDWASFPAPSNPEDPKTWPSVFIPTVGAKVISKSIKAYKERVLKENPEATLPDFTVSTSKEPKGVRVFRKA